MTIDGLEIEEVLQERFNDFCRRLEPEHSTLSKRLILSYFIEPGDLLMGHFRYNVAWPARFSDHTLNMTTTIYVISQEQQHNSLHEINYHVLRYNSIPRLVLVTSVDNNYITVLSDSKCRTIELPFYLHNFKHIILRKSH